MTTRRDAIMTAVTALGAAICDALDLPETGEPTPTVPAEPVQYGAIVAPAPPVITAEPQARGNPISRTAGQSIVQSDVHWTDSWMAWKGNDVSDGPLVEVRCEDILLERFGPYIVMRGAPSIQLSRIASLEARHSSYGIGFLRATDVIGKLRASDLRFVGADPVANANDAFAPICLWGKDGDTCTDWAIERFDFRNVIMAEGGNYQNADGISVERGHDFGLIEHGVIKNVSDAGIDCKGYNCRINQVDIESARQSLKLWDATPHHGRIVSRTPRFAHILAASDNEQVLDEPIIIDRLEAPDAPDKPVVAFEGGKTVIIKMLIAPEGQKLYTTTGKARTADKPAELWVNGERVL